MNQELAITSNVKQNPNFVTSEMDGEIVMMSVENSKYYGMTKVASVIWPLIVTPVAIETVVAQLLEQFDVTKEQCEQDVMAFFENAVQEKVVEIVAPKNA